MGILKRGDQGRPSRCPDSRRECSAGARRTARPSVARARPDRRCASNRSPNPTSALHCCSGRLLPPALQPTLCSFTREASRAQVLLFDAPRRRRYTELWNTGEYVPRGTSPKAQAPILAQAPVLFPHHSRTGERAGRKARPHRRSNVWSRQKGFAESLRYQGQGERREMRALLFLFSKEWVQGTVHLVCLAQTDDRYSP